MGMLRWIAMVIAGLVLQSLVASGEPVFETTDMPPTLSLEAFRGVISAARPAIAVEVPQANGKSAVLNLDGKGGGPDYVWHLYSLGNSSPVGRHVVLSVPFSQFPGSGVLLPRRPGSSVIQITTSNPSIPGETVASYSADAVSLTLAPGEVMTVAIQGGALTPPAQLWERNAFEFRSSQMSFARGAVLGIAGLALLAALALLSLRPHRVTAAGAAFAGVAVLFSALENGILTQVLETFNLQSGNSILVRAVIETLMFIVAAMMLHAFSGITRVAPSYGIALLAAIGIGCANLILAFVEPERATTVARVGFALTAVVGFLLMLQARNRQILAIDGGFLFWSALTAWTLLACVLALITFQDARLSVLMLAALCGTLIVLGYILVRFSFGDGYLAKAHLTDQVRRSLALAGARHHLWDWSPSDGEIDYGEDFAAGLGYRADILDDGGQDLFIELLHPEDRPEFVAGADAVAAGDSKHIEIDLRLKAADGHYHWFALRSRALPGRGKAELRCIGTLTDISKTKELEQRLLVDSVHDPISGLPSRAIFMDRLQRSAASKSAPAVHVLLIDLDRFKHLNDGLGHDIGDQLLRISGQRIADTAGDDATVARMSGSQFAVLFTAIGKGADPQPLADAIGASLAEPIETGARPHTLSASIGISRRSAYGMEADELLGQAASALHAAKEKGLGSIVLYEPSMRDDRAADVALESDLRRAIGRAEIEVHYQPIMQLANLDIVGFEALARWRHPQLGIIAPEYFIDAAERAGLIGDIGRFMMSEASRQLGLWQRTLFRNRDIFVAVNVSASQLLETEFIGHIQHILSRELLAPGSLKVEVTESVVMRYPERVERLFGHLRAMGIGLACDDFGTGFSSLSSLRDLPFDTLKLDRSFVEGDEFDDRTAHIISAIVGLAHGLGMTVVAEGIETQQQIDHLSALGCDYGQGFLLGTPVTAKEIEVILAPPLTPSPHAQPGFASRTLSTAPFPNAPLPGHAPMAPRVPVREATEEPVPLPSIFAVTKGKISKPRKAKKKAARRKAKRPEKLADEAA